MLLGVSLPIPLFDQNRGEVQRAVGERAPAGQGQAWAKGQADGEVRRLTRRRAVAVLIGDLGASLVVTANALWLATMRTEG